MLTSASIPSLLQALQDFATNVAETLSSPDIDWTRQPDPYSWSLAEVMCHLRDVENEVHQVRFRALLAEENPFISGVSSDDWAETRKYCWQDGAAARDAFLTNRQNTLLLLQGLNEAEWNRIGTHAFFGPTTLLELVNLAVNHDQVHWQQIIDLIEL